MRERQRAALAVPPAILARAAPPPRCRVWPQGRRSKARSVARIEGVTRLQSSRCFTGVWWLDVGEDALTSKGTAADTVVIIRNGGAFEASDKVRGCGAAPHASHVATSVRAVASAHVALAQAPGQHVGRAATPNLAVPHTGISQGVQVLCTARTLCSAWACQAQPASRPTKQAALLRRSSSTMAPAP